MICTIIPYNFFVQSWATTCEVTLPDSDILLEECVFWTVRLELSLVISRLFEFCGGFSVLFLSRHKWALDSSFFPCLVFCYIFINHITISLNMR